jgi:hypothetical protein
MQIMFAPPINITFSKQLKYIWKKFGVYLFIIYFEREFNFSSFCSLLRII